MKTFIKQVATGKVAIRVRWNAKKCSVDFIPGVCVDVERWDATQQRAIKGTTHKIGNDPHAPGIAASAINARLAAFEEAIQRSFEYFRLRNHLPTTEELKEKVNREMGRVEKEMVVKAKEKEKTLRQLFADFILEGKRKDNWNEKCVEKYTQAFNHYMEANPRISPKRITEESMLKLKEWYIENHYKNRTINHRITVLKRFLRYVDSLDEFSVSSAVLNFNSNLKVLKHSVSFLYFDELMHFANFVFDGDKSGRLTKARDLWCFMAFTSLRYSDLASLKVGHIVDGCRIEKTAQKTGDRLIIPLNDYALAILEKYKDQTLPDGYVFDTATNQKLNDAVKDAARAAGLTRMFTDTYEAGTERIETQHEFCDIISCHDARRTFVSCSLAMGMSAESVMKCTGHASYTTMKPYIETALQTQKLEMERWNKNQYRSQIIGLLDDSDTAELQELLAYIKALKEEKQQKSTAEA